MLYDEYGVQIDCIIVVEHVVKTAMEEGGLIIPHLSGVSDDEFFKVVQAILQSYNATVKYASESILPMAKELTLEHYLMLLIKAKGGMNKREEKTSSSVEEDSDSSDNAEEDGDEETDSSGDEADESGHDSDG